MPDVFSAALNPIKTLILSLPMVDQGWVWVWGVGVGGGGGEGKVNFIHHSACKFTVHF